MITGKFTNFQFWVYENVYGKIIANGSKETLGDLIEFDDKMNPAKPIRKIWAKDKREAIRKYKELEKDY